jgi:hypothetical protein
MCVKQFSARGGAKRAAKVVKFSLAGKKSAGMKYFWLFNLSRGHENQPFPSQLVSATRNPQTLKP